MPINSYSLVAGYSGTPVNIESISVTGGEDLHPFYSLMQAATYFHVATDTPFTRAYVKSVGGTWTQAGYPTFTWAIPIIGVTSYKYLMDTYAQANSTHRGRVTVGARSDEFDVYDDYNADMFLEPAMEKMRRGTAFYFRNVIARFIVKGAA